MSTPVDNAPTKPAAYGPSLLLRRPNLAIGGAIILALVAIALVSPEPVATWLDGAAFNLGWLVVYLLSTVLLWNGGRRAEGLSRR